MTTMLSDGPRQECLCSLGLAEECPAHPFRQRREKVKPDAGEIRHAPCAACAAVGLREHVADRHRLSGYSEVATALKVGTVYVSLEKYNEVPMVVRDCKTVGGLMLQVLEGWQTGPFTEIWMNAK